MFIAAFSYVHCCFFLCALLLFSYVHCCFFPMCFATFFLCALLLTVVGLLRIVLLSCVYLCYLMCIVLLCVHCCLTYFSCRIAG
jgi:hypothetical protein